MSTRSSSSTRNEPLYRVAASLGRSTENGGPPLISLLVFESDEQRAAARRHQRSEVLRVALAHRWRQRDQCGPIVSGLHGPEQFRRELQRIPFQHLERVGSMPTERSEPFDFDVGPLLLAEKLLDGQCAQLRTDDAVAANRQPDHIEALAAEWHIDAGAWHHVSECHQRSRNGVRSATGEIRSDGLANADARSRDPRDFRPASMSRRIVEFRLAAGRLRAVRRNLLAGDACFSVIHAPRSISRQRSLQNGRHFASADHSTGRWHVGHGNVGMAACSRLKACGQVQSASKNGTSPVICTGCVPASCQERKRMLTR